MWHGLPCAASHFLSSRLACPLAYLLGVAIPAPYSAGASSGERPRLRKHHARPAHLRSGDFGLAARRPPSGGDISSALSMARLMAVSYLRAMRAIS